MKQSFLLPEGFSAGFSRRIVTPETGTSLGGFPGANKRLSDTVIDDLTLSCLALSDGEEVILLFSSDSIHVGKPIADAVANIALEEYGIPEEHVLMNATHTHSGPSLYSGRGVGIEKYTSEIYYPAAKALMGEALRDLAPARVRVGRVDTTGRNYVRRYMNQVTGEYAGKNIPFHSDPAVFEHETEADHEMQAVSFDRGDKKEILLCNWQCHATHVGKSKETKVSSDFVGAFRTAAEEKGDIHFFYLQGAAGNVTPSGRLEGDNRNADHIGQGEKLAELLYAARERAKPVATGKIKLCRLTLSVPFSHRYCLEEHKLFGTATELYLFAVSLGDLCIGTVPGEWHDVLGMELKKKSPYAVTLVGAYTNGCNGYFPASFAFDHGGYEVKACRHERGTSEMFLETLLSLLKEMYPSRMD